MSLFCYIFIRHGPCADLESFDRVGGSNFDVFCFFSVFFFFVVVLFCFVFDEGREDKRAIIGPPAKRWWPNIECWLKRFVIFRGSGPVLYFCDFSGVGVPTPVPASGSAHVFDTCSCQPLLLVRVSRSGSTFSFCKISRKRQKSFIQGIDGPGTYHFILNSFLKCLCNKKESMIRNYHNHWSCWYKHT